MPVKVSKPAPATEAPKNAALDAATLKQIQKLTLPLAKKAQGIRVAQESLEKSTFSFYADFREIARENFNPTGKLKEANRKAIRQLAVNVLASVYDVPITSINLRGIDTAVWVYPAEYVNAKGKTVPHPKKGQEIDMEEADDATKEIAIHPTVPRAAMLYQRASRYLAVAVPEDDRAREIVDEVLSEDGTCAVTEAQLYQLATATIRDVAPKGSQGGARTVKSWDAKSLTAEIEKIARKAWNGNELLSGFKGSMDLEEIVEAGTAAFANMEAELEKATKAQAKAAKRAGKAAPADEEAEED